MDTTGSPFVIPGEIKDLWKRELNSQRLRSSPFKKKIRNGDRQSLGVSGKDILG